MATCKHLLFDNQQEQLVHSQDDQRHTEIARDPVEWSNPCVNDFMGCATVLIGEEDMYLIVILAI